MDRVQIKSVVLIPAQRLDEGIIERIGIIYGRAVKYERATALFVVVIVAAIRICAYKFVDIFFCRRCMKPRRLYCFPFKRDVFVEVPNMPFSPLVFYRLFKLTF